MKFEDIEQRTEAWYKARLGKPTASKFGDFINAKGELKVEGAKSYEAELLAERFFGFNEQKQARIEANAAVRYGIEHEAEALEALRVRELESVQVLRGGFFREDPLGRYGCSPDGRIEVGNRRELVEVKCPEPETQIKTLVYGWDQTGSTADKYRAQVQAQLMISGYSCVHFFSYRHDCPSFYCKVEPDRAYIAKARVLIERFCLDLDMHEEQLRKLGRFG